MNRPGHGAAILTSLGSTRTSWAIRARSGWPLGHLDCGLRRVRVPEAEGFWRAPCWADTRGVPGPHVSLPGARMPLCPQGGSAQDGPSLCGPPANALSSGSAGAASFSICRLLMAPSHQKASLPGLGCHVIGQGCCPSQRAPDAGTEEVAQCRLCAWVAVVGPW